MIGPTMPSRSFSKYLDLGDDDERFWGAIQTIECCALLVSWLISQEQIYQLSKHNNFSVRSCAASICWNLSEFAPDRVPLDVRMQLSVFDEDWYVEAPANAALKTLVRSCRAVLRIYHQRLLSENEEEASHAAAALRDIAEHEPGLLDRARLSDAAASLKKRGNDEATRLLSEALVKTKGVARIPTGGPYGL
jgi:hypothetical protein